MSPTTAAYRSGRRRAAGTARARWSSAASRPPRASPHRRRRSGLCRVAMRPGDRPRWVSSQSCDSPAMVRRPWKSSWVCVHGPMVSATSTPRSRRCRYCCKRLLQEQVLPAADQQHRHLHPVERGAESHRLPERLVVIGMVEPRLPPRRAGAQQLPAGRTQRQLTGGAYHAFLRPQLADAGADSSGIFLVRNQMAPAQEVVDGERAGAPGRLAEIVGTGGDDGRGQLGRRILQQRPLGEPEIGNPDGGEATGEPRLLPQPCDGVGAVGRFVDHRREGPARPERPPHTLHQHVVAAGGVQRAVQQRERKPAAIRSAEQQGADRFCPAGT